MSAPVRLAALALGWACLARGAPAQSVSGAIKGRVSNSTGVALANVVAEALGHGDRSLGTAVSDARGYFRLMALPVGTCTVVLPDHGARRR
jgi:carboxypeptidase family protein